MTTLGTTQTVIVCVNGSGGVQGACPSGQVESVVSAYLVSSSEAARLDLMAEPFDAATAGAFFGFAFVSTIFVYLTAVGGGVLLQLVKRR